jgi:hypothetical protein
MFVNEKRKVRRGKAKKIPEMKRAAGYIRERGSR